MVWKNKRRSLKREHARYYSELAEALAFGRHAKAGGSVGKLYSGKKERPQMRSDWRLLAGGNVDRWQKIGKLGVIEQILTILGRWPQRLWFRSQMVCSRGSGSSSISYVVRLLSICILNLSIELSKSLGRRGRNSTNSKVRKIDMRKVRMSSKLTIKWSFLVLFFFLWICN